jgi:hypothetical protein
VGGDEGTRTLNPRLAKAVLCQLSYVPQASASACRHRPADGLPSALRHHRIGCLRPQVLLGFAGVQLGDDQPAGGSDQHREQQLLDQGIAVLPALTEPLR